MTESYEDLIVNMGCICTQTKGTSMQPLLYSGRDTVFIVKNHERLKKWDIALYKRKDGTYVLHRVMKVLPDGYVFCGDNHSHLEYGITDENIIGVAEGYYKKEKYHKFKGNFLYFLYKIFWCSSLRLRNCFLKIKYKYFPSNPEDVK